MRVIYHVAGRSDWDATVTSGAYAASASPADGFVVCVGPDDYVSFANRFFRGRRDTLLLFIDTLRLSQQLRLETVGGTPVLLHPSPLPVSAVFETAELSVGDDARFVAHHETSALAAREAVTFADVRERAVAAMAGWDRRWWIAGGWALDLFLGHETRPHADLELSILSADQPALYTQLAGWDLRAVAPGSALVPWNGELLAPPYHQIWARRSSRRAETVTEFSSDPTMLDFLIEDHTGERWRFRRDHRIARDVQEFGTSRDGLPFVRPEIALLYKAKQPRHKDREDFRRVAPLLSDGARAWLRASLDEAAPAHSWSKELEPAKP